MKRQGSIFTELIVTMLFMGFVFMNGCALPAATASPQPSGFPSRMPPATQTPAPSKAADTSAPVIQLIGSNPASVSLVHDSTKVEGDNGYADPGAVASDVLDGDLTSKIVVSGEVDTKAAGTYTLTYTVADSAGNQAAVKRTVNIVDRLDPSSIKKYVTPLFIPWAMPKSQDPNPAPDTDYYEIAMRQFEQQILPEGLPKTTVWGYGSASDPKAVFHAPSLTIEAAANRPVRIKWINDLKDMNGNYLPHFLPVDQTLHWANPSGDMKDMHGTSQKPYVGPVPIVTHVHGAHVAQESDGYPEAWYLPAAKNIPAKSALTGTYYNIYKKTAQSGAQWSPGSAVFDYSNDQRDATLWYHDHTMGMTRTNVYAGPAGFYLIRGGKAEPVDSKTGKPAVLPGPAPMTAPSGSVYEIPIVIQDRSFNADGSLYYPDSRSVFDGFAGPYAPESDIAPIWNPEFFGDTIVVNGNTWPFLNVEPKRYRFRFLNGSQARTLILSLKDITASKTKLDFWQIGADGGFLASPAKLSQIRMGPAERADVIVDFSKAAVGDIIRLNNLGPDDPFNGGKQAPANPVTTGQVMEFRIVADPAKTPDLSTPPEQLLLPTVPPLVPTAPARQVSLNEASSEKLFDNSNPPVAIGPKAALLGTVEKDAKTGLVIKGLPKLWSSDVSENIALNSTEVWEIYNYTEDAHPIHLHLVEFQVVNRQLFDQATGKLIGKPLSPSAAETGFKDTVLAYPGQITRIRAKFDRSGRYVWHCHILEHEDNEMMRPYIVK
jgi:spore coat protein A